MNKALFLSVSLTVTLIWSPAIAGSCMPPSSLIPCKTCHSLTADRPSSLTGSNLNQVFEAPIADRDDFKYSQALLDAKAKDLVWTAENLDGYLADPSRFLTGVNGRKGVNKMLYQVRNEETRQTIIEGLKALSLCE